MVDVKIYFIAHHQPIIGLIIGALMLLVAIVSNVGDRKVKLLNWIAKYRYRNGPVINSRASRFLDGLTLYLCLTGSMLIILAVYFLQNIA